MRPPRSLLAALLALGGVASAQPRPVAISAVEHALGASPIHMVAGHGRMSLGVTRKGDVAVLTWPSPSCCDQLTYLASNALDARSRPRTGVRDGFGVALGLALRTASGERVAWLHDETVWEIDARYRDDAGLEPTFRYRHRSLGVRVEVTDVILPERDVFERVVRVTREAGSAVTEVSLLSHVNLGLTQNVVPRIPMGDVVADGRNDFGLLWDRDAGAFVQYRPADRAPIRDLGGLISPGALPTDFFGPLDALMRADGDITTQVAAAVAELDARHPGGGVFAVFGTDVAPTGFQAGREDGAFCEELDAMVGNILSLRDAGVPLGIDPTAAQAFRCTDPLRPAAVASARGWTRAAEPAWRDAQDGALSGNPAAAWLSDAALRTPVALDGGGSGGARLLIAFGASHSAARSAFTAARAQGADAAVQSSAQAWAARTFALPTSLPSRIPEADRARIVAASRRAIQHVLAGTDAATGMIVASIARQAPYGLDWPRDGAFFDYALDVAGLQANVTRRLDWALPLARREPLSRAQLNLLTDPLPPVDPRSGARQYPEAAWEMNYYNTGEMGGFFRFEIDNTALMVWSAAVHLAFVPEGDRRAMAERWYPQVQRSADLLAEWRDAATGLHAPANEDDNAAFTVTLHGAVTVYAGLDASARMARLLGRTTDAVRWERRASELRDAVLRAFYDREGGRFVSEATGAASTNPGSSPLGATAWLVWPAQMLPVNDPRVAAQVRRDLEQILRTLRGDDGVEGGAYLTKTTLSAAAFLAAGGDPSLAPLLDDAMVRIARDVMDPVTHVMGEVFVHIRDGAGRSIRLENRVSQPHLWEATLFYLSAMAMSDPTRFDPSQRALPASMIPPPGTVPLPGVAMDAGLPDAGATAAMDAGPRSAATSGGCGCRASGVGRGAAGWLLVAAAMNLLRRRRHRTGRHA